MARPLTLQSGILSARNAENARTAKKKGCVPSHRRRAALTQAGGRGGLDCATLSCPCPLLIAPFFICFPASVNGAHLPSLTTSGGDQETPPRPRNVHAGLDPTPSCMIRLTFQRFQLTFNKGLSQRTTNGGWALRLGRPAPEETPATAVIQSAGVSGGSGARRHMEIGSLLKGIMRARCLGAGSLFSSRSGGC